MNLSTMESRKTFWKRMLWFWIIFAAADAGSMIAFGYSAMRASQLGVAAGFACLALTMLQEPNFKSARYRVWITLTGILMSIGFIFLVVEIAGLR